MTGIDGNVQVASEPGVDDDGIDVREDVADNDNALPPETVENGIDAGGTYHWRNADGTETLRFGQDGSFAFESTEETTPGREWGGGASDEGVIDLPGGIRSLDRVDIAATVEQVRNTESSAGGGVKFDGDGDGIKDDRVYVNEFGGLTTVESEGSMETSDANGNYGFVDGEGNVFQGNGDDGTFIHLRADGTATWRTDDGVGETVRGDDGELFSTETGADGNPRAVDGHPSGLLTLPGIREGGVMEIIDDRMSAGFFSPEVQTMLDALAQTDLG